MTPQLPHFDESFVAPIDVGTRLVTSLLTLPKDIVDARAELDSSRTFVSLIGQGPVVFHHRGWFRPR
jgi:hypothetical protein